MILISNYYICHYIAYARIQRDVCSKIILILIMLLNTYILFELMLCVRTISLYYYLGILMVHKTLK